MTEAEIYRNSDTYRLNRWAKLSEYEKAQEPKEAEYIKKIINQ
jgi:hypothetical protein